MPVYRVATYLGSSALERKLLELEAAGEDVVHIASAVEDGTTEHVIVTRAARKQTRPAR